MWPDRWTSEWGRAAEGRTARGRAATRLTVNGLDSCCSVVVARMASFHGPDAVGPLLLEAASADMAAVTAVRCSAARCSSGGGGDSRGVRLVCTVPSHNHRNDVVSSEK